MSTITKKELIDQIAERIQEPDYWLDQQLKKHERMLMNRTIKIDQL